MKILLLGCILLPLLIDSSTLTGDVGNDEVNLPNRFRWIYLVSNDMNRNLHWQNALIDHNCNRQLLFMAAKDMYDRYELESFRMIWDICQGQIPFIDPQVTSIVRLISRYPDVSVDYFVAIAKHECTAPMIDQMMKRPLGYASLWALKKFCNVDLPMVQAYMRKYGYRLQRRARNFLYSWRNFLLLQQVSWPYSSIVQSNEGTKPASKFASLESRVSIKGNIYSSHNSIDTLLGFSSNACFYSQPGIIGVVFGQSRPQINLGKLESLRHLVKQLPTNNGFAFANIVRKKDSKGNSDANFIQVAVSGPMEAVVFKMFNGLATIEFSTLDRDITSSKQFVFYHQLPAEHDMIVMLSLRKVFMDVGDLKSPLIFTSLADFPDAVKLFLQTAIKNQSGPSKILLSSAYLY